jgi:hypothetical protein
VGAILGDRAASAANYSWKTTGSGNWSNAANWTGGAPPVSADDTVISFDAGGNGYTSNNNLDNPFTLRTLALHGAAAGTRTLSGSRLRFVSGTFFTGLFIDGARPWTVNNDIELATDVYLLADTGSNVTSLNGAFSGPGRALLFGGTNTSFVINGTGHTHAGTEIVAGVVRLGAGANLGPNPVAVTGAYSQQTTRLIVPSATNIASGDGSLRLTGGNFVEFGSLANNAVQRFSADSDGVLAVAPDTVQPASINMATAARLRLGVSSTNAGQVVALSSAITPGENTYRLGGMSTFISTPFNLSNAGAWSNVLPTLDVTSALTNGPGAAPRSVNIGGTYLNLGDIHQQGKVRLSNLSNSYSGGTLVERNPASNGDPAYLVFDYTPAAGQTPLGTGPVVVQGGLIFEGANGSLGALPNAIEFQPGSILSFNNLSGTNTLTEFQRDRWPDGRPLALNGTDVELRVVNTFEEKVGPMSYAGGSGLRFTYAGFGTATVRTDSLARVGQGTLTIRAASGKNADVNQLRVGTNAGAAPVDPVTGMVHPSVVFDNGSSSQFGFNANYLRVDATGVLRSIPFGNLNPNSDNEIAGVGSSLSNDETVWALHAYSLALNGKTLTIRSGGLILAGGDVTGDGGIDFSDGGPRVEALVYVRNNQDVTIAPPITAAGFTKFGTGSLTLGNVNQIFGPVAINEGSLTVGAPAALTDDNPLYVGYAGSLSLSGNSVTVSSLTGAGSISPGTASATLTVDAATDCVFEGRLTDNVERDRLLSLTKTGPGTLTLNGVNPFNTTSGAGTPNQIGGYAGLTTISQGMLVAAEQFLRYGSYRTEAGARLVFQTDHKVGDVDGFGTTAVAAGATLTANHVRQARLEVPAGATVRMIRGGGDNGTSAVSELALSAGGTLDLADDGLIVDYTGASAAAMIRGLIRTGVTNGSGLVSGGAPASFGLGYAEARDLLGLPEGGTGGWGGVAVDDTAILVRLTRRGDANLDGTVDFNDLVMLAQHYNNASGARTWWEGDFTYDGNVDFNDLVTLAQNYNTSVNDPPMPAAVAGDWERALASVPEPGVAVGAAAAGLLPLGRRRRRT